MGVYDVTIPFSCFFFFGKVSIHITKRLLLARWLGTHGQAFALGGMGGGLAWEQNGRDVFRSD